jgi:hypothetical protein
MPEDLPEFLVDKAYIRKFIKDCEFYKNAGRDQAYVREGERLARAFRQLFPDVSDKDLGTIVLSFVQVLSKLSIIPVCEFGAALDSATASYGYAAADILNTVLAIDDMTS